MKFVWFVIAIIYSLICLAIYIFKDKINISYTIVLFMLIASIILASVACIITSRNKAELSDLFNGIKKLFKMDN
jgi:predicted ferric reductase